MSPSRPRKPSVPKREELDAHSTQNEASTAGPPPSRPDGRDNQGRFSKANPGGPGNPFARQVAKLRSALVQQVTEADMKRIAEDLIVKAKLGDLAAIKLLFLYVLGRPAPTVNPDTLAIEEWQQLIRPIPQIMQELPVAMMTVPVETATGMVQIMQPFVQAKFAQQMAVPQEEAEPVLNEAAKGNEVPHEVQASEPAQRAKTAPSANGSGGRKKMAGPSANGGSNGHRPVPPWLTKIAASAKLASAKPRNGRPRTG